uniref:Cytochrome P450 n=1 Tax=Timema cristinae TaxID=61476 RepID=A0A7R9GY87_TIMCR|nr:unnamed protein product [Timema cristinae]
MTSSVKPIASEGCDIIQGRVSTCLVDPPNWRQVVIYSCLDMSCQHARLARGMSHQGCDRAMTSSVKPIASEGCDIIQRSCLDLYCRPTKLAPGMSHQGCDRAMTSSVKPIANEGCDIIQGRDLFLSRHVLSTRQTGPGHDLFLSLLVLSSHQTGPGMSHQGKPRGEGGRECCDITCNDYVTGKKDCFKVTIYSCLYLSCQAAKLAPEFLQAVVKLHKEYGSIIRLWLGADLFVVLSDPKYIENVSREMRKTPEIIHMLQTTSNATDWVSNLDLGVKGSQVQFECNALDHLDKAEIVILLWQRAKWKSHRKIITPTFHFKILENFMDVFNLNGQKLVDKLQKEVNGPEFDICPYVTLCTLDIICETAMGISINAQDGGSADFVEATKVITDAIICRTFKPWLQPEIFFRMSPTGKGHAKALEVLHGLTEKVIQTRKAEYLSKHNSTQEDSSENENDIGAKKRRAFLDMLLESVQDGNMMSDADIREEVDTFMFAEKAVEELNSIFGDSNRNATYRDIQEMKYLEMVIKENQRLLPSVPIFTRNLKQDVAIDGYIIPKGANVAIAPILIHRDPNLFPDPEIFNPERFSPENSLGRHPYQFISFSAGARNCIGQKYAMLEMKSTVSKVLRNYRLLPGSTTNKIEELVGEIVLKNINGIKLKLLPRKLQTS